MPSRSGRCSPGTARTSAVRAIEEIRRQYLPLAHSDAKWLALVARSHSTELPDGTRLPDLARYFDSLLVMPYDDGREWWDVHPLIRDEVLAQAEAPGCGA